MARPTLREALAQSHVAGVGTAVLLLRFLDTGVRGLLNPLPGVVDSSATAIAIRGIPTYYSPFTGLALLTTFFYLLTALIFLLAALLLARWVYNQTPLGVLRSFRDKLAEGS